MVDSFLYVIFQLMYLNASSSWSGHQVMSVVPDEGSREYGSQVPDQRRGSLRSRMEHITVVRDIDKVSLDFGTCLDMRLYATIVSCLVQICPGRLDHHDAP